MTDLLHMKIKCGECNRDREPEGDHFDTAVFFLFADTHTASGLSL